MLVIKVALSRWKTVRILHILQHVLYVRYVRRVSEKCTETLPDLQHRGQCCRQLFFLGLWLSNTPQDQCAHTFHVPRGVCTLAWMYSLFSCWFFFSLNKLKWPHFSSASCFCYCYNYSFFLVFAWRAPYFLQEFTVAQAICLSVKA